jgi:hypothetical protein
LVRDGESWNPIRARIKPDSPLKKTHRKHGELGWFCVPVHEGCARCYASNMNQWRGTGLAYQAQLLEHVEFLLDERVFIEPRIWRKPRRVLPDWRAGRLSTTQAWRATIGGRAKSTPIPIARAAPIGRSTGAIRMAAAMSRSSMGRWRKRERAIILMR